MPPNTAQYSGFRAVDLSQRPATAVQVAAMLSTSSACAAMLIVLPSDRFEPLWLPATLREALAACKAKPALCVAAALMWANDAGGLPSGSEGEAAMPSAALPPSPATAALPAAAAATQPPATAAAQPLSPTAVQCAADADAAAAAVAVPAGATNAPVPARAVAATRSVAATRRATAAPQPHPPQVSQLQPVEVLQLLQSARQRLPQLCFHLLLMQWQWSQGHQEVLV
ncbi:TPA: hypothetical protein ACH3X2_011235 [Trebouxia sp. C0005]